MRILEQVFDVITRPPGDLVYFLVTLFALQQALVSALAAFRADRDRSLARRWLWATGGMLLGRLVLVLLGLVGVAGLLSPSALLPSLERWVLFAHILGLLWAGLLDDRFEAWRGPALLGSLAVSLLVYGYGAIAQAAVGLPPLPWDPRIHELLGILLALFLALAAGVLVRPREWEWGVGVVVFWIVGSVGQLLWTDSATPVDGWLRLSSLAALPLLSIWVHRQLLEAPPVVIAPDGAEGTLIGARPLLDVLQIVRAARDLDSSLILASSKLAKLLDVEICVVALAEDTMARVVAIHPPTSAQIHPPELLLADYEGLQVARDRGQAVVAMSPTDDVWLVPLFAALGFEKTLPLVTLPLSRAGRFLGFLLLGEPADGELWEASDLQTPVFVAEQLATAIATAQHGTAASSPASRPAVDAVTPGEGGETDRDAERAAMVEALEKAKEQFQALNSRIRTLLQEIKARDEEILALNQELESRRRGASESELSVWQNEVRQLATEREDFERQIQELTEDRDLLLNERSRLNDAVDDMKAQLDQVEGHRERLEEELVSVRTKIEERDAALAEMQTQTVVASEPVPVETQIGEPTHAVEMHAGAVGIIVADEDGQITTADSVARLMLRLPEGDVVGLPVDGAYADPQWSRAVDDLLAPLDAGGLNRYHLTLAVAEGTVEADFASLRGRDGEADGLIITLRSSESGAERYEALVSLANDFRTPMTAITGYADLLLGEQAGILTEMQQQFLERVRANIEQLSVLLNDLIRVTSPDTRPIELLPRPVSLIEIIEEAIMGLSARFRERRLTVQLDLPPELALVEADRDSLYQIMLRLLSNAAVCSKEGSQVVVSAQEQTFDGNGKHLEISVTDTGGGIAPEDYPRVFRHFYRANQPLVQGMGETSVGMAMAKTLVEANGGRIWVDSTEGVGSTLRFVLPCEAESPA